MKKYLVLLFISIIILLPFTKIDHIEGENIIFYEELKKEVQKVNASSVIVGFYNYEAHKTTYYVINSDIDKQYCIASVTKTFTATIILQLYEEQQLDLETPVNYIIPVNLSDNITIRHLLSHTGKTNGQRYWYDNDHYILLAKIIEKITELSYETNVYERVINPLNMNNTHAKYANGTGGIYSTYKDFVIYSRALIEEDLLKDHSLYYETSKELSTNQSWYRGLGWDITKKNNKMIHYFKGGRWGNAASGIQIYPEEKMAIIFLMNAPNVVRPEFMHWMRHFLFFLDKHFIASSNINSK